MPVMGHLPLTLTDLKAVPVVEEEEPFGMVQFSGTCAWVPVPGWQVILRAEDPVALLAQVQDLGLDLPRPTEEVLVIVDRDQRQWHEDCYFWWRRMGSYRCSGLRRLLSRSFMGRWFW